MIKWLFLSVWTFMLALSCTDAAQGQSIPTLSITAPSGGLIATPGATIQVNVTGANLPSPASEFVSGQIPIAMTTMVPAGPSLTFSLAIPSSIQAGTYQIGATLMWAGGVIESAPINVNIPQSVPFTQLALSLSFVTLYRVGEKAHLGVEGLTAHNQVPIDKSLITFQSANPAVASVNQYGVVTAVSNGSTQILCTYAAVPVLGEPALTATAQVTVAANH